VELIRSWLRLWRVEHVEVTSAMSVDEAEAALAAAVETVATAARADFISSPRIVVGWVHHRRIRVSARPPGIGYSWNSRLRAKLVPAREGSRLIGRLGCPVEDRVFSALLLTCALAFFASGLVQLTRSETQGHGTGGYLPLRLGPVAVMAVLIGVIGFFGSAGRKNGQFLRRWIIRTLRVGDSGSPEQDGPIHQSR
jgi:hypothetical protein